MRNKNNEFYLLNFKGITILMVMIQTNNAITCYVGSTESISTQNCTNNTYCQVYTFSSFYNLYLLKKKNKIS